MATLPNLKELVFCDTPFTELMNKRIYNILLIATKYDAFMLEDDGRVDEQIFNEYNSLNLRYPPRFTQVTTEEEALKELSDRHFELIIVMPNMDKRDTFATAKEIKEQYPESTIVVLTPFSKEVTKRFASEDLSSIDYVFSWLGDTELLLAIIKLIEDKWNAPHDTAEANVQNIILVEDSVRFYSAALPTLFKCVLEQSLEFSKEALNDQLKTMRMRGRPKIHLARSYEEAMSLLEEYKGNILGVVTDMSFKRNGAKDALAGYELCKRIKAADENIPLILESSEDENKRYADLLQIPFLRKRSKKHAKDLRAAVMAEFGFGDFFIINPENGEALFKISTLHDLQVNLRKIPEASLSYHLRKDHFSRFFFSRAMFPPAMILKRLKIEEFKSIEDIRNFIFDLIVEYRHMKNEGVVAIYQKDRFDEYASFARIGKGSLGGKGRGLAFMAAMVRRYPKLEQENFTVNIPKTVALCSDIYDEFMEKNNLYRIAYSGAKDADILEAFENAELPERVNDDLLSLSKVTKGPIAVRSSSLLEDAHYQPFAGIYSTYMIPNLSDELAMVRNMKNAIKAVYASVFYKDSKAYLLATQNLIQQEKMSVVLQEVVGGRRGRYFYPTMSGVARSLNFYPIGNEEAGDGVANIALGLGKYIVDGGLTLRFSPNYPRHVLQLSTLDLALKETQTKFCALDLDKPLTHFETDESFNIPTLPLKVAEEDGTLREVCSTYDYNDQMIRPGYEERGRKLVTFQGILQFDRFPVAETIKRLLDIGKREMGRNVEIEFAVNIEQNKAHFYLLQMRPIVDMDEEVDESAFANLSEEDIIVRSANVLGNGVIKDVCDIVYVKSENFKAENNHKIAEEIRALNRRFLESGKEYVLVGPGRWGSRDPWLGIPVVWPDICGARIIVECGLASYQIDPSQGTHFFQNLTSFGVGYFTINPFKKEGVFNEDLLNALPAEHETEWVRQVHFEQPLAIKMNGRKGKGAVSVQPAVMRKTEEDSAPA